MDYIDFFPKRLEELRLQKNVSARDMSLSLGQSESYINKIENRRTMPSMAGFFYICEYLGISPKEFFDVNTHAPKKVNEICKASSLLTPTQADHILEIIHDITRK